MGVVYGDDSSNPIYVFLFVTIYYQFYLHLSFHTFSSLLMKFLLKKKQTNKQMGSIHRLLDLNLVICEL